MHTVRNIIVLLALAVLPVFSAVPPAGFLPETSGIDAEASIAAGAHIIYKDTNNSTNDFHQRKVASIKK